MSYRIHGLIGILAFFAAAGVGVGALASRGAAPAAAPGVHGGVAPAVAYGLVVVAATLTILYTYCAKCPCRRSRCSHVFVGRLTALVPRRGQAPYHRGDHAALLAALFAVALAPQPWLVRSPRSLIAFWVLLLSAAGLIIARVCPECRNVRCPMHRIRRPGTGGCVGPRETDRA